MSELTNPTSWPTARCYTAEDGWKKIPDPLRPGEGRPLPTESIARAAGFEAWSFIGASFKSAPIVLSVFFWVGRTGHDDPLPEMPGFVVFVEGSFGEDYHVYAEDLPAVMELLGKWTPVAQAAAVVNFASALDPINADEGDLRPNLAELLGRIGRGSASTIAEKLEHIYNILDKIDDRAFAALADLSRIADK